MDYDDRIQYWSGRAAVARRVNRREEAEMCARIAGILRELKRESTRVEAQVERLIDEMPVELMEAER